MKKEQKNKKYYDNLYTNTWKADYENQPARNMRYHFSLSEFKKILEIKENWNNLKILDYGCGNGYLLNIIKNKFNLNDENLFGFDISSKAINIGKEKYNFNFFNDVEELKKNKFDIILFIDVIEHIEEDEKVLTDLNYLLKENGNLLISTSLYNFYWTKSDDIGGHVRRYTKKELILKAEKTNFNVSKIYTYGFPFGTVYMLLKGIFIGESPESESKLKEKYGNKFLIKILKKLFIFNIPFLGNQVIVNLRKK